MKIRKILGGCAWVLLAVMLFLVNASADSADGILAQQTKSSVSSVAN